VLPPSPRLLLRHLLPVAESLLLLLLLVHERSLAVCIPFGNRPSGGLRLRLRFICNLVGGGWRTSYRGHVEAIELVRVRRLVATGAARALRESAGLSMTETAQAAGVAKTTIWRWETRQRRPRGATVERYAKVLEDLSR
jgi:DNA-binding XRE family transcriptional regulator